MYCSQCGQWAPDTDNTCAQCGAALQVERRVSATIPGAASASLDPSAAPAVPAAVYGGLWRRAWALLVDGVLLFFPQAIVRVALGLSATGSILEDYSDHRAQLAFGVQSLLAWIYFAAMESSRAQGTLGKQLLGLRVTTLDGGRASFARATARHVAKLVSELLCMMGFLFNLWTPRRQTLHDMIAGCVIVRADAPASHAAGAPHVLGTP